MKNKIIAILSAALLCFGGMCGITAHANYDSTAAAPAATETPKPARTISTAGAGHVVDNISDSDKLQFISVTAKDGSVFFIVIDKQNVNDNVYFLNKVDISDLEALAKENSAAVPGPVNRGVEFSSSVIDGEQSVIHEQVTNGVAVRMAVMYILSRGGFED